MVYAIPQKVYSYNYKDNLGAKENKKISEGLGELLYFVPYTKSYQAEMITEQINLYTYEQYYSGYYIDLDLSIMGY